MDGWKELEKMDLELMHALHQEWNGERMRAARRSDFERAQRRLALNPVAIVVAAGAIAAILIGLSVTNLISLPL